jgi:hypothetical protein
LFLVLRGKADATESRRRRLQLRYLEDPWNFHNGFGKLVCRRRRSIERSGKFDKPPCFGRWRIYRVRNWRRGFLCRGLLLAVCGSQIV